MALLSKKPSAAVSDAKARKEGTGVTFEDVNDEMQRKIKVMQKRSSSVQGQPRALAGAKKRPATES